MTNQGQDEGQRLPALSRQSPGSMDSPLPPERLLLACGSRRERCVVEIDIVCHGLSVEREVGLPFLVDWDGVFGQARTCIDKWWPYVLEQETDEPANRSGNLPKRLHSVFLTSIGSDGSRPNAYTSSATSDQESESQAARHIPMMPNCL